MVALRRQQHRLRLRQLVTLSAGTKRTLVVAPSLSSSRCQTAEYPWHCHCHGRCVVVIAYRCRARTTTVATCYRLLCNMMQCIYFRLLLILPMNFRYHLCCCCCLLRALRTNGRHSSSPSSNFARFSTHRCSPFIL